MFVFSFRFLGTYANIDYSDGAGMNLMGAYSKQKYTYIHHMWCVFFCGDDDFDGDGGGVISLLLM
jgi:hypothetical protein